MDDEIQKTQEEEQDLRNSDRCEKSIPVNEVARKMTLFTAGGEEDDPTGFSKLKMEEQETAKDKKEAVEKPDLKRRRDMWEQSHVEDSPSSDWDLPDATPTPGRIGDAKKKLPRVADSDVNPAAGVTPDPIPAGMSTPKLAGLATMVSATPPAAAYEPIPDAINTLASLWKKAHEERNRPLTDEEFDAMFLLLSKRDVPEDGLPEPKDYQYFGSLWNKKDGEALSPNQLVELNIMKLLLELKNGTPHQMKTALRQLIDYTREVDPTPFLNQILPLLMRRILNNQERRLMVKIMSRVLYELDELIRPCMSRIIGLGALLMNKDSNVRAEGTEIMYNLSKAAGLNAMIDALRPSIRDPSVYFRMETARSFCVVASALGIAALLPFVKEVCLNRKSWPTRHTGFMIVHEIIGFHGAAVLPHVRSLVEIIELGLSDKSSKARTVATLALDALNKFAAQYGIKI